MYKHIRYESKNGGVNNLQIVHIKLDNGKEKTFSSLKGLAEKYANTWIEKNKTIYYFAGAIYYTDTTSYKTHFEAVRSTNGLPYVTTDKNGLDSTSHHSSLYRLSEDLMTAHLEKHRGGGVIESPKKVKLSEKLQNEFKKIINNKDFY